MLENFTHDGEITDVFFIDVDFSRTFSGAKIEVIWVRRLRFDFRVVLEYKGAISIL